MSTAIYDEKYHKRFLERANTDLGRKIYAARWAMIHRHAPGNLHLLDYGCASGAFHQSAPNGYLCDGFDVNPHCGFPASVIATKQFDILTMWDVIEHLHEPLQVIKQICPRFLFLSTPNLECVTEPVRNWRHYRPAEHLYYFDRHSLKELLEYAGYEVVEVNYEEGELRDPDHPLAIISMAAIARSR